jgi:hypothetical protein
MNYSDKAFNIVRNSINSAIFIDEKAKDFYSFEPINSQIAEEQLSINLHQGFKANGISLAVHKFEKKDVENDSLKKYLFKDRDLILLDWELDGIAGEEYSLKLLSEIINYPHLNFCCIYTRTKRFETIFSQVETYFSGFDRNDFEMIKNTYSHLDENKDLQSLQKILTGDEANKLQRIRDDLGVEIEIHPFINDQSFTKLELANSIKSAFAKNVKSERKEPRANSIVAGTDSFIINNTFVFLLAKDSDKDPDPSSLIRRISDEVVKNKNSFLQLLGLEMQTIFNENERFIDENFLNSSTSALFRHRNYLKKQQKNDVTFTSIIKRILLEHAGLRLRTAKLTLLDTDFLDEESKNYNSSPTVEELLLINTFYNSVAVKSLNNIDIPNLNFGDVFRDENDVYYLCITALCDCLYPNKIDHNFYFALGHEIDLNIALKLGDTAFINFLPDGKAVNWGNLEQLKEEKVKKTELETEEQFKVRVLVSENKAYQDFLYKPYYVKPKIFNVEGVKMNDKKLKIWELSYKAAKDGNLLEHDIRNKEIYYVTTLRTDYAQRVANHAFGHPARVGVDFIKS